MENEIQVMKPAQLQFFGSTEGFELCQRMAKVFATSTLVPTQYQNNMSNCIIAMEMASRIGASPLQVMQNLYIVHGNPGFSAKFLIACINASGKFSPLRYEFKGTENTDDWSCRAYAVDKEGEVLHGAWVSIKMAKAEGWYGKNGSKWQTMPQLMLQYRAAAFFQRTYAPEISLGMQSAEELYDEAELVDTKLNNAPAASPENIAAEMEKQENANTETLGMGDGKAADPAPAAPASPANDGNAAPAGGVKPMGAQKVPDMFK
ncbi:MAG: hypothetical protein IKZ87_06590 [Actinomycetaceae bacterium]|nr:hypothetical protein [Actinomycetaceae bacterium]